MTTSIGIIGMSGRFPDAKNLSSLRKNLIAGRYSIDEISADRLRRTTLPLEREYWKRAYLDGIDHFDYKLFGLSLAEAQSMDPHQRLMLEVVYETIEQAGYSPDTFRGSNTAVFVADLQLNYWEHADEATPTLLTGNISEFLASRINRSFDLHGGVGMVDTSCSSSLVALHMACNELLLGHADQALVCGVSLELFPEKKEGVEFDVVSPDGHSKPFSASSNGMAFGEVVGCVLLKRVTDAERDKDTIHAIIKSTSINNNGARSSSLTAPESLSQAQVLRQAWDRAGINPCDLGFIEVHGSGTQLGDSIEVGGLNAAFSHYTDQKQVCPISTIKSNIGHGRVAAGLAGLLKTVLALKYQEHYPSLHCEELSSLIDFDKSAVYVNQKYQVWEKEEDKPRYAGVSSMGLSGTNAHIVLEEYVSQELPVKNVAESHSKELILLSGLDEAALKRNISAFDLALEENKDKRISDIAYTLATGRNHYKCRLGIVAGSIHELREILQHETLPSLFSHTTNKDRKLIWVFDRADGINIKTLERLAETHSSFRNAYESCLKNCPAQTKSHPSFLQFAFQYASYTMLSFYGVESEHILELGPAQLLSRVLSEELSLSEAIKSLSNADLEKQEPRGSVFIDRVVALVDRETTDKEVDFLLIGNESVFQTALKAHAKYQDQFWLYRFGTEKERREVSSLAVFLYAQGYNLNWSQYFAAKEVSKVELPGYQFAPTRCWIREEPRKVESDTLIKSELIVDAAPSEIIYVLAEIWAEILQVNQLQKEDDFFKLGGDSLQATRLIRQINNKFNIRLDFEDIFDFPTLEQLADYVTESCGTMGQISLFWKEVLNVETLETDANFFELGGHSLLANQLLNRIETNFNLTLNFEDVFSHPTLVGLSEHIDKLISVRKSNPENRTIPIIAEQPYYALSHGQKRMWLISQYENSSTAYNNCLAYKLTGDVNVEALKRAYEILVERHESLRTVFINIAGEPQQKVQEYTPAIGLNFEDLSGEEDPQQAAQILVDSSTGLAFDLEKGPLFRANLLFLGKSTYVFYLIIHHIISDEWSLQVLFTELSHLYDAQTKEISHSLSPLRIQYKDYASWQSQLLDTNTSKNLETYWLDQFSGELPVLSLPTDYPRPSTKTYRGGTITHIIEGEALESLREFVQASGASVFMGLLAISKLLLYRYTSQTDLIIGFPIAGREDTELEQQIGIYANTLALRTHLDENKSFKELLNQIKETAIGAYSNQLYPLDALIYKLELERNPSRSPLFDVLLVYQQAHRQVVPSMVGEHIQIEPFEQEVQTSQFDLTLEFVDQGDRLRMNLVYNADLFEHSTGSQIAKHWEQLLDAIIDQPTTSIAELNFLSGSEKHELKKSFNQPGLDTESAPSFLSLFEEQVQLHPNVTALQYQKEKMSYAELNAAAEYWACQIGEQSSDTIIPIMAATSFQMIIGMIAVLKSGAAYLPLDISLPQQRVAYMLEDCKATKVITQKAFIDKFSNCAAELLLIDEHEPKHKLSQSWQNSHKARGKDLAYVIYTSGSTGKPKGVMIEQQNLSARLASETQLLELDEEIVCVISTNYSFDVSILEIFLPLSLGGKIIIPEQDLKKDIFYLTSLIQENGVTDLQGTPGFMEALVQTIEVLPTYNQQFPLLKRLCIGGESFSHNLFQRLRTIFPTQEINNHYGPTEITIDAVVHRNLESFSANIIGSPIPNTSIYILDKYKNLVPVGVFGEIYIGGHGVARGYLNQSDLSQDKFHKDLFGPDSTGRIYQTGDWARWLPTGTIEFKGRIDQQVKIRGHRIELEEIEQSLLSCFGVKEAAVTVQSSQNLNQDLHAFLTLKNNSIKTSTGSYSIQTADHDPALQWKMEAMHIGSWPSYFEGDQHLRGNWSKLYKQFPQFQLAVFNEEKQLVAVANTIPICWNGNTEDLPESWNEALLKGLSTYDLNSPNTLCILAAAIDENQRGKRLSHLVLKAMRFLGFTHKYENIIVPLRPTGKEKHPEMDMETYCTLKREDGQAQDHWLRVHVQQGGEIIGYCSDSQTIKGTIDQWEKWSGLTFEKSGFYQVQNAMSPVEINLESDLGTYHDMAVWLKHEQESSLIDFTRKVDVASIREHLKSSLPSYMMPTTITVLDDFPRTSGGKINRRQLLAHTKTSVSELEENYRAPQTEDEKRLLEIFESVLGRRGIGVEDNFFLIGGDSIKAIQIAARLYSEGYKLEIRDLFQGGSVATIAPYLKPLERLADQSVVEGEIPLTPIQHLFFEDWAERIPNLQQSLWLESTAGFEPEMVTQVFEKLCEHHDALRIAFSPGIDAPTQLNLGSNAPLQFEVINLKDQENPEQEAGRQAGRVLNQLDIFADSLYQIQLFQLPEADFIFIAFHHLVIDGLSWRIILEDIENLFSQYQKGEILSLPPKTDSFLNWAQKLEKYADEPDFYLIEQAYWENLELDKIPEILPDGPNPTSADIRKHLSFQINAEKTDYLLTSVHKPYHTEINDILLTALGLAFKEVWEVDRLALGLEGHGREDLFAELDISRTIGWFTSFYPIVLDLSGGSLPKQLRSVKESLHQVPRRGIGYGILRYLSSATISEKTSSISNWTPKLTFNYFGQFEETDEEHSFNVSDQIQVLGHEEGCLYDFDISGWVVEKQLGITIAYPEGRFKESTIVRLTEAFESALYKIMDHCKGQTKSMLSPSDLTYKQIPLPKLDDLQNRYPIEDIYPLSPMQEGMLYHSLADVDSSAYFEQVSYRLEGGMLDPDLVAKSLSFISRRHATLRTIFPLTLSDRLLQLVLKEKEIGFYYEDLSDYQDKTEKEARVKEFKSADRTALFNLQDGPLMRVALLKLDKKVYEFVWSSHHILMDGWCIAILTEEYSHVYSSFEQGETPSLPPVQSYQKYINWLETQDRKAAQAYWQNYLEDYEQIASLPSLIQKGNQEKIDKHTVSFMLSTDQTSGLQQFAAEEQVTLNTLIQFIWGLLLSNYAQQLDVVFGAVVSGRPARLIGVESMVGLFINTVPVRIRFEKEKSVPELLRTIQDNALAGEAYHYYPLSRIQAESAVGQGLINHILVFENYPVKDKIEEGLETEDNGIQVEAMEVFEQNNYDFSVVISPGESLHIKFDYQPTIYQKSQMRSLRDHFMTLVDGLLNGKHAKWEDLPTFAQAEIKLVEDEFSWGALQDLSYESIQKGFEAQVRRTPDTIALTMQGDSYSFSQLNQSANKLSAYLSEHYQVKSGDIVAIRMSRSIELIVSILAVIKTGAAYLPIDLYAPLDRMVYMLEDSGATLFFTREDDAGTDTETIQTAQLLYEEKLWKDSSTENPNQPIESNSPVYIIYTSGSTGSPKGVVIPHRALANYVQWFNSEFHIQPTDQTILLSSVAYDLSYSALWPALMGGACLHLLPEDRYLEGKEIRQIFDQHAISFLKLTPSHFAALEDIWGQPIKDSSLRLILLGGEKIEPGALTKFLKTSPETVFINHYGPTETTIGTIFQKITLDNLETFSEQPVIGKPISNSRVFILDQDGQTLPLGITGEISISGKGLALGYINNSQSTDRVFIEDSSKSDSRIYRTGDLGRWLSNGTIEFLGRKDHQVKLRGFRIELGELERGLVKHPQINNAVAILAQKDRPVLCVYIETSVQLKSEEISEFLGAFLPYYMLPNHYFFLEQLPLLANGKINRRCLSRNQNLPLIQKREFIHPKNEKEALLVEIFQQTLQLENVRTDDDFFEIGGDSIIAVRIAAKLHDAGFQASVRELMQTPNIIALAQTIRLIPLPDSQIKESQVAENKPHIELSDDELESLFDE